MSEHDGPLSCEAVQWALEERLSGEEISHDVASHIRSCPGCQEAAAQLGRLVTLMRQVPVPEPPPAFWSALHATLEEEVLRGKRRRVWGAVGWAAAAAAVLLAVGGPERLELRPAPGSWVAERLMEELWPIPVDHLASVGEAGSLALRLAAVLEREVAPAHLARAAEIHAIQSSDAPAWDLLARLKGGELRWVVARLEHEKEREP